jgi:tRNA dimethylallyltransferase
MSEFRHYFLTGCTAAGKTSVAHHIAKQKSYAILSTDSMQIYQDMNIGTAKATEQELSEVEYYGIDICPPTDNYSLWDFCQYSKKIFQENKDKTFIVTGGTGL